MVGDAAATSFRVVGALDLSMELARESPRAGRSTRWVELYEDPEVAGESSGVGEEASEVSIRGLFIRPAKSGAGEPCEGDRASDCLLASAFLFLGTSCSLKGSVACDAGGEASWLRDRSLPVDAGSRAGSARFRSVSDRFSDG